MLFWVVASVPVHSEQSRAPDGRTRPTKRKKAAPAPKPTPTPVAAPEPAPTPLAPQKVTRSGPTHELGTRVGYLKAALTAVQRAQGDVLQQAHGNLAVYERGACSAASQRLRVECLMTAGRRYCQKRPRAEASDCALYVDVVVSNLVAEKQLFPVDERYAIMKRAKDWRREMARQTRRMQGALAVDFQLRMGAPADNAGLAKSIDTFCAESADETELSWQTCATSLIWFIAASAVDLEPRTSE